MGGGTFSGFGAEQERSVSAALSGKDRSYKPMVKSNGAERKSEGAVVAVTGGQQNRPVAKGPHFGHAGKGGKRKGMAGTARPNHPGGHEPLDNVRKLQRRLWTAAKQSPGRRFHALYDRIYRGDVLAEAWRRVRCNRGAAGVDGETLAAVEAYGVERLLAELHRDLREGTYRPAPVLRRHIPKRDGGERPLGIPTVRDRVVQQAAKIVLEPIFEADFLSCSHGYRLHRSATDALEVIRKSFIAGFTQALEVDITDFFDRLGHDLALDCMRERISDRRVLMLIRSILRAGVLEGDTLFRPGEGAPQGGPISPLVANVVLHRVDRAWSELPYRRLGVLVRYCDDLVICCPTKERAEAALDALATLLSNLGLNLSGSKTQIIDMASDEHGFDFLGFHHRMMPSRRRPSVQYPACWPSDKAMARARAQIREITARSQRHIPTHILVAALNQFLRGWRQYYRWGNSTVRFAELDRYVMERVALLLSKRHHRRGRGHGMKLIILSGNRLGIERLVGTVGIA
jgi:RNA-directed DNA polymerase